jgi:glycosyltransferase involved in cell wall biosynthesis
MKQTLEPMLQPSARFARPAVTRPDVSVVIPTRDRWQLLLRAVRTALGQRGVTFEVIVADDGSQRSAPSQPILSDPRVTVLRQAPLGVAAARNAGARHAAGRWLAFLDDDDIWAPHKLTSLLEAANEDEAHFAYSSAVLITDDLTPLVIEAAPPTERLLHRMLERNAIPGSASNVVVDRALFEQVGGFDESFSFLADWDAWLRIAQAAHPVRVAEPLMAYSCHTGNWVLRADAAVESDYRRLSEKHAELAERHGVAPDRLVYDRYVAGSYLRVGRRSAAARRYMQAGLRERDVRTLARGIVAPVAPRLLARLRRPIRPQAPAWLRAHEPIAPTP